MQQQAWYILFNMHVYIFFLNFIADLFSAAYDIIWHISGIQGWF